MDWVMLGALGEIIGAGAVVLTLWYLASQIGQEAVRELMDQTTKVTAWLNDTPQHARLWIRGVSDDPHLSAEELAQFRAFVLQLALVIQRVYFLNQKARLEEWFVSYIESVRQEIAGSPGFRSWYETRSHWLHPSFRAVLEADMNRHLDYRPLGLRADQVASAKSE